MAHALLVRAAQLVEQARTLNDEYQDKSQMPAEVTNRIDRLLDESQNCKRQVEREKSIDAMDSYLSTPDHQHQPGYTTPDSTAVSNGAGKNGRGKNAVNRLPGEFLTPEERKRELRAGFLNYIRKGVVPQAMNADLVEDADGELLVPADYVGTITKELPNRAVMRRVAFVQPTTSDRAEVGVVNVAQAGWGKLELPASTVTDGLGGAPTKETVYVEDLVALVKIGVDELADADDDLEAVIRNALTPVLAEQEDTGFANGAGHASEEPAGFGVSAAITQGLTTSNGVGVFTPTKDDLKSLVYEVPQAARANGAYIGSSDAEKTVALLTDDFGRYLLQPNAALGEPPTLFGYRWYTNDGLPAIGASAKPVFFGDWMLGYRIVDRQRITVQRLNELFITEGKIGLLFKERVGGDVINENALAALTIQAS